MREEYDFANGERGKFHNPDATMQFNTQITLCPETQTWQGFQECLNF